MLLSTRRSASAAAGRVVGGRVSPGRILASTFATLFRGLPLFLGVTLLILVPFLATWYLTTTGMASEVDPDGMFFDEWVFYFAVIECGFLLALYLVTQFAAAVVVYGVFRRLTAKRAGLVKCLATAFRRLAQILGVALLMGLSVVACFVPGIACLWVSPALAFIVLLTGLFLCPMVCMALYVAPAVVVVEHLGVMASLRRSVAFTRGNRLPVFGIWVVIWVVGIAALVGINVVLARLTAVTAHWWLGSIAEVVVIGGFTALRATAVGVVLHDLKMAVDGAHEDELAAMFD